MHDHINDVLAHLSDDHIAEAAHYRRPGAGLRKAAVCLLVTACCAALLAVGVTAWQVYVRLDLESDGLRRYTYRLLDEVPAAAPTELHTIYLPDVAGLGLGHQIAYCGTQETSDGEGVYTVFYNDPDRIQITMHQFTFRAFQNYRRKLASADYMYTGSHTVVINGMEVLCLESDGRVEDIYWSDGSYCYGIHCSSELTDDQWSFLVTSLYPVEDYAAIAAAHPYYHPDSGTLDSIVVPTVLPEDIGTLHRGITRYWAGWTLYDENGYGVRFDQWPLDQRNYYTERNGSGLSYGGQSLYWISVAGMAINVCETAGFRDYRWVEGGDECQLRFDKETGLDFDALARQIIESLTRMDAASAEAHYISLQ